MPEVKTTLWTSEFTKRFSFRLMATSAVVAAAVACGEVERDDVASIARRAAPASVKVVADGWAQGAGAGFVIRGYDGAALVVTNSHVLLGATRATIEFRDGRSLSASLVGSDPAVDLAILRLSSAAGVTPLVIADDGPLVAGERLVVIGNPAGLQGVVTAGVLSARTVLPDPTIMGQAFVPFLITDAATSAGNSGSPVLDRRGEVIGVSSAILGSAHNLTVVLPGHLVSRIGTALQHAGTYRHAYAGLDVTVATGERPEGACVVTAVAPGGAADRAGLRVGDRVAAIDGEPPGGPAALLERAFMASPGTTWTLEVVRGDATLASRLLLDELPERLEDVLRPHAR